jgi:hypothetical protein
MTNACAMHELDDPSRWVVSVGDGWQPIPEWALYCIQLGMAFNAATEIVSERMVVCISVPLRPYVTALVVAGYYIGRIKRGSMVEQAAWFDELRARSTPVLASYLIQRESQFVIYKGYLDPPHEGNCLRLKYGPNLWTLIDVNHVRSVSLHPGPVGPIGKTRTPVILKDESSFWQEAGFNPAAAMAALRDNTLEAVVVGIRQELITEFTSLSLRVCADGQTGLTLAQLSGVRTLSSCYQAKTEIINPRSEATLPSTPSFYIFDGRGAFLQCADRFGDCHQLIVADRLSVQHHIATVNRVNTLYIDSRSDQDIRDLFPLAPHGIGFSAFILRKKK